MSIYDLSRLNIAVLLPCYNEGKTIADVVSGFQKALPSARIFVYDNNSTDDTERQARGAGALVVKCRRQGKGNVVRMMFADIEADVYVMADGDGTYRPEDAPTLVEALVSESADMVVGTRRNVTEDAGRKGHAFGNKIFNRLFQTLFGSDFTDIFSGYRAFTRRYAKSFPAVSPGFEIETEMSVHASSLRLPIQEIELHYGRRVEGSESKLSTFRDGIRILRMMVTLLKESRPLSFFCSIGLVLALLGVALAIPVVLDYLETGLVNRVPTWIFAMALIQGAGLSVFCGLVLDSVARGRVEIKRMHYMSIPPARGEGPTGLLPGKWSSI